MVVVYKYSNLTSGVTGTQLRELSLFESPSGKDSDYAGKLVVVSRKT